VPVEGIEQENRPAHEREHPTDRPALPQEERGDRKDEVTDDKEAMGHDSPRMSPPERIKKRARNPF
jgi:hypothetical protein